MHNLKKDLILLGAQGSGKGTQGRVLYEKYDVPFFEMGAYLRRLIEENPNDKFSKEVASFIDKGRLIPDDYVNEIIRTFIVQHEHEKIIFDGVCRTLNQKHNFSNLMKELDRDFLVIYINIDKEEAIKRLTTRKICTKCKTTYSSSYKEDRCSFIYDSGHECNGELTQRKDDSNMESINNRLDSFYNNTVPVINSYKKEDKLIEIDGTLSIDKVSLQIEGALAEFGM